MSGQAAEAEEVIVAINLSTRQPVETDGPTLRLVGFRRLVRFEPDGPTGMAAVFHDALYSQPRPEVVW